MVKMASSAAQTDKFSKEMAISLTQDLLKQCEAVQNEHQGIVDNVGPNIKEKFIKFMTIARFCNQAPITGKTNEVHKYHNSAEKT